MLATLLATAWFGATSGSNLAHEIIALANPCNESLLPRLHELRDAGIPVYLRVGSLDLATPPGKSQGIYDAFGSSPGATLVVVPGVGHALLDEDPQGTIGGVVGFIDRPCVGQGAVCFTAADCCTAGSTCTAGVCVNP